MQCNVCETIALIFEMVYWVCMYKRIFLTFALAGFVGALRAEQPPSLDISAATLALIGNELGCKNAAAPNAAVGCEILSQFSAAARPDPAVLKESSGPAGRRWMGVTIVSDKSSNPREGFESTSPYLNLIVLGARYSGNFHKKMYFENGYGYSYIWPTNKRQVAMIEQASSALASTELDQGGPAASFARQLDLKFQAALPSAGTSMLLGDESRFLRQKGDVLYMIELGSSKEGVDKYYLSRIHLTALMK